MNSHDRNGNAFEQFTAIWRRRRLLIFAVFFIVAIPTFCATFALPDVYEAKATVIPIGSAISQQHSLAEDRSAVDSLTEQVLSRDRLAAVIEKFGLYPNAKGGAISETAAMRKDILIQPKKTGGSDSNHQPYAIDVMYRSGDPRKVAAVTNYLAGSFETVASDIQATSFNNAAEDLRRQLKMMRVKLDKQQALIDRYSDEHRGELPEQQDANLAAMQRLDRRLGENDSRQMRLMESKMDLLQKMDQSGSSDFSQSNLPQLEQRLSDLELQYTDKYPEVIALKERIEKLNKQQRGAGNSEISKTPQEQQLAQINAALGALQREETKLRAQISRYQQNLNDAPLTAQRLKSLTQGYTQTSDLYSSLLTRYEQVRIAQATSPQSGPQYQVLESAMVPTSPSGPGRLKLLLIFLVLSFGAAAIAAVIAEQFDTSFHSVEELQAFTSLPVLATVPLISTPSDILRKRGRVAVALAGVLAVVAVLGAGATLYTHGNQMLAQKFSHHLGSKNS